MNKETNDWINPKVEVRNSHTEGKGMFARETIKKGEKVVVWKGVYTDSIGASVAKQQGKLAMQWDDNLFSIEDRGDDQGYFINHSCDSNLWMQDAYTLTAKTDILPNEEITADYALWETDENYISSWNCKCGSSLCRNQITGKDWQSVDIQKRYQDHFSPLINKRIKNKKA